LGKTAAVKAFALTFCGYPAFCVFGKREIMAHEKTAIIRCGREFSDRTFFPLLPGHWDSGVGKTERFRNIVNLSVFPESLSNSQRRGR
jgi:hypothetical protein